MDTTAIIKWDFVPGSLGTLVEYRQEGTSTWITPSTSPNPTTNNFYVLDIDFNIFYDIRLTTQGATCGPGSITLQIVAPGSNCCPGGYTLSGDNTYCFQTNTTAATPPSSPENTVAESFIGYSVWGTLIYDPGFNVNGTGTFTQIPYSNGFWVNGAGYPTGTGADTIQGPLNRTGLWATTTMDNQTLGFTQCVTLPENGIYYIGVGVDNYASIYVDGNLVLQMDATAMGVYWSANGYPGLGPEGTFRFWNIYPISLSAGNHVLEVIGTNISGIATLGTEIYDTTKAGLISATSYTDLGSSLIFSTKNVIGESVQVGNGGFGYTCPSGYSLVLCDGPAFCTQTLTAATIEC